MLTDPSREVVDLAVHDGPTIGRATVSFYCIEGDRLSGIGGGIYCRWCRNPNGN